MPANLVDGVDGDASPQRRAWLAGVPGTVAAAARRWSLDVGEPYQPGGRSAWVAPVTDAAGRRLVLKVGWPHAEAVHEADGLRVWDGAGAVRLRRALTTEDSSVLLLERCDPGTDLASSVPETDQDVVIARLLSRLWLSPPPGHPFRPLQEMCDAWAAEARRRAATGPCDRGLVEDGLALLQALPAGATRTVLLCTDLHAGNVLAAGREPWLMIDPKPYTGDPAYDPVQHLLNCEARLSADPVALAARMSDLLDLDGERLRQWLFARCVQESFDQPWLARVATRLARSLT